MYTLLNIFSSIPLGAMSPPKSPTGTKNDGPTKSPSSASLSKFHNKVSYKKKCFLDPDWYYYPDRHLQRNEFAHEFSFSTDLYPCKVFSFSLWTGSLTLLFRSMTQVMDKLKSVLHLKEDSNQDENQEDTRGQSWRTGSEGTRAPRQRRRTVCSRTLHDEALWWPRTSKPKNKKKRRFCRR